MRLPIYLLIFAVSALPVAILAKDFGNDSVVALTQADIGVDVLLAKISSLPCSYDVSTDAIVALKKAGVANIVIAAMVDRCAGAAKAQGGISEASDPAAKRKPGIYLDQDITPTYQLKSIRPSTANGIRTTGNGSVLFPFRAILALPRAAAQVVAADNKPAFYFYFETDDANVSDFGSSASASAQSPAEFSLVRFKLKDGQREMTVAKQKAFSGSSMGVDPKDAIQFDVDEIGDGVFKVSPLVPLAAGEYGFLLRAGSEAYRVYDFQVPY
jgi:hypothetical protein